jgi:hypothetical protein
MRTVKPLELAKGDVIYYDGLTFIVESVYQLQWSDVEVVTHDLHLTIDVNEDIELLWKN